ncbi:2Fe-2S iron-sulfur cluster-binding protein [Pigmentiphaga sp. D-2]|uniref:2Fe-2S iron-sulfur cluster-binding protein n=1 Tax=Pigmentiphaga sp. D-2 TaxID=1002116 RepID=UPI001A9D4A1A|nr:2Fe-2S iron-sulfur cluster-binding protein [Pigmentiphaga sp. D-2]
MRKHQVRILGGGESYACEAGQTLLAGMESGCRRDIPVGCRGGGCGVCRVRIVHGPYAAGRMSRAWVSAEDEARGIVLACRTRPLDDVVVEVVGRRPVLP